MLEKEKKNKKKRKREEGRRTARDVEQMRKSYATQRKKERKRLLYCTQVYSVK